MDRGRYKRGNDCSDPKTQSHVDADDLDPAIARGPLWVVFSFGLLQ
jgi:hypothetical protein